MALEFDKLAFSAVYDYIISMMGKTCKNTITFSRINRRKQSLRAGFTLIEMSIVLVIIGLIVGGVLVGQDLIAAAAIRAQISQIERYNTAVRTFQIKYGGLPGDLDAGLVTQLGFATIPTRLGTRAQGDGNGVIEGIYSGGILISGQAGETAWFWVDLTSNSGLIDGVFSAATATPTAGQTAYFFSQYPYISQLLPNAKIGQGNSIYVFSESGINYFGIANIPSTDTNGVIQHGTPALSVVQAYNIDKKIDDGQPQTGSVTARLANWSLKTSGQYNDGIIYAAGTSGGVTVAGPNGTTATSPTTSTCFDNGGNGGTQQYSMSQNNGAGLNCALAFKFQ